MGRKINRVSTARKDRRSYRKGAEGADAEGIESAEGAGYTAFAGGAGIGEPGSERVPFSKVTGSNPLDTAAYILEMTLALRDIASESKLDFLAYLLDMAAEEADGHLRAKVQAPAARASREIA